MTGTPTQRFWAKVNTSLGQGPQGECWCWTAGMMSNGLYGQFSWKGKPVIASRFAYTEATWEALTCHDIIRHTCDNPRCVRPSHLIKGTHADNVADRVVRGRTRTGHLHGEDNPLAKLNEANVREIRTSPETALAIANRLEVSRDLVYRVRAGTRWKHVA